MCGNLISWTVILTDRSHTSSFSSLYVRISPLVARLSNCKAICKPRFECHSVLFILLSTTHGVVPISPRYHKVCKELASHLTIQSNAINCFGSHFIYELSTTHSFNQTIYLYSLIWIIGVLFKIYSRVTIFTDGYSLDHEQHTLYTLDGKYSKGQACNSQSKLINSEYLKHPLSS